jgi:uncharacterized protein YdbL (DUF1318 family)
MLVFILICHVITVVMMTPSAVNVEPSSVMITGKVEETLIWYIAQIVENSGGEC